MAGSVALEDVETTAKDQDTTSDSKADINADQTTEAGNEAKDAGDTSESAAETSAETSDAGGQASGKEGAVSDAGAVKSFEIGGKVYTEAELNENLQKIGRYQGDRDRAEKALENIVAGIRTQGYEVDPQTRQIYRLQAQPAPQQRQELLEAAAAGDTNALNTLLEVERRETASAIFQGVQAYQTDAETLGKVATEYPEFYKKDGTGNIVKDQNGINVIDYDSPLSREAAKILEANPGLGTPKGMMTVGELAKARLLKNGLPKLKQQIVDKAQQRLAQTASTATGSPGGSEASAGETMELTAEQKRINTKLGVSNDRVIKAIQRANKTGGYEIS
uniref:Uncharacterized protein n=1 Tax=viral metagenome TaxID=1070528 RepID=A0A6H1ZBV2_9ZZZZ